MITKMQHLDSFVAIELTYEIWIVDAIDFTKYILCRNKETPALIATSGPIDPRLTLESC